MEAETVLVLPQAKKCQELPTAGKGKEGFLTEVVLEGPAHHLGFRLVASRTEREYLPVVLSHRVCGDWLGQP